MITQEWAKREYEKSLDPETIGSKFISAEALKRIQKAKKRKAEEKKRKQEKRDRACFEIYKKPLSEEEMKYKDERWIDDYNEKRNYYLEKFKS